MTEPIIMRPRVVGAMHLLVSVLRDEIAGEGRAETEKRVALTRALLASLTEHVALVVKDGEVVWRG